MDTHKTKRLAGQRQAEGLSRSTGLTFGLTSGAERKRKVPLSVCIFKRYNPMKVHFVPRLKGRCRCVGAPISLR